MNFLHGLALPFSALRLIFKTPKLRGLTIICGLVASLTLVASAVGAWELGGVIAGHLISSDAGWKHAASVGLHVVLTVPLFALLALTLPNLVLSPLQDPLSEHTERTLGPYTPTDGGFVRGTLISLRHTLVRLALMLVGLAVLFPLNLVPGVGSLLWFALSTTWSAFWLAAEYLSGPMARHLHRFRDVLAALRATPARTFGFGYALTLLLWVPVLNVFLMPVAVVAGTLLYREDTP